MDALISMHALIKQRAKFVTNDDDYSMSRAILAIILPSALQAMRVHKFILTDNNGE